jgi:nucleotide-binding universal stress UspA family protein
MGMEPKPSAVVVAYDFSSFGQAVLDRAVALVSRAPFHVLHFITVVDPHKNDPDYADRVRDVLAKRVGKALAASPIAEEVQFHVHSRIGRPAEEILQLASEIGADLILIGTHGHTGLTRMVMGSVAERVVREAGCAVLVARPKSYADVELMQVFEVTRTRPTTSRHTYSYSDKAEVTRPPDWPLQ